MNKKGKLVILGLVVFILLVSLSLYFVLASTTNTKTYDPETKIVTISNGATQVADIKLNTPQVYNVIRGKDRLVAEFTIENYADTSDVFNDMEFYDLKGGEKEIQRDFTYKYKVIARQKEIPHYRDECTTNEEYPDNITICNKILESTTYEDIVEWSTFDEKAVLPEGDITIGIFTDVYAGDYVEWIPTLYNQRLTEWASWNETFNQDLIAYYYFSNFSNYFQTGDFRNADGNSPVTFVTSLCKNGNCTNSTSAGSVTDQSSNLFNLNSTENRTLNWWFNPDTGAGEGNTFVGHYSAGDKWRIADFPGGNVFIAGVGQCADTGFTWASGQIMFTIIANDSGAFYYQNTTLVCSAIRPTDNTGYLYIGRQGSNTTVPNVYMDDLMVWNRSLSTSEIASLYDSGTGIFYDIVENYTITFNLTNADTGEQIELGGPPPKYLLGYGM